MTMRIRMMTMMAGPEGVVHPGEVVEVTEEKGAALVKEGFAELVGQPALETAMREPPEVATPRPWRGRKK